MLDFAQHYLEMMRHLEYTRINAGSPINMLYDGVDGAPDIRIPNNDTWVDLNNSNYQTFHPDLALMANDTPQYRINITEQSGSRSKHIRMDCQWSPPLNASRRIAITYDVVVYPEIH